MKTLQLVAVGTGRDGTVSLNFFLNQLFRNEGKGRRSCHEYASRECYNAFAQFSSGDALALEPVRRLLADCPYGAIVGNGQAFVLPHLRDALDENVRFIHLQRRDRSACIESYIKLSRLFPQSSGNYSPRTEVEFLVQRTAAFHLGEMSQPDWERLSLFEKYAWYYDKTHALLDQIAGSFTHSMHVYTEDLNSQDTLRSIADFAGVETTEPFTTPHKNAFAYGDISRIEPFFIDKAQWLYSNFDFNAGVRDDTHAIDYFCERFLSWKGYQLFNEDKGELTKYKQTLEDLVDDTDKVIERLERSLVACKLLKKTVRRRMRLHWFPSFREVFSRKAPAK